MGVADELGSTISLWAAVISAVVTFVGVIAQFVQVRFAALRPQIFAEIVGISQLESRELAGGVKVAYFHDGKELKTPVATMQVSIENTGKRDVTKTEFVGPICLKAPNNVELLSAEVVAAEGVDWEIDMTQSQVNISWGILKPAEKILMSVVATLTDGMESRISDWHLNVRLKDVRNAPRSDSLTNQLILFGAIAALVFLGAAIFWRT